jgi:hypothetical protein
MERLSTHEERVYLRRQQIRKCALDILNHIGDLTLNIRFIWKKWYRAELPEEDLYLGIVNIEDDLDRIPKGTDRERYSEEELQKFDALEAEILDFFREGIIAAAHEIIKLVDSYPPPDVKDEWGFDVYPQHKENP